MSFNVVKGDAPRITALNVSDAQLSSLVTGNSKVLWIIIIVFIQIFGPVAYLLFGRKEDRIDEDS